MRIPRRFHENDGPDKEITNAVTGGLHGSNELEEWRGRHRFGERAREGINRP
jgi:hypothetical protein